jgi:hypothetical protein
MNTKLWYPKVINNKIIFLIEYPGGFYIKEEIELK